MIYPNMSPDSLIGMMVNGYSIEPGADLGGAGLSHADLNDMHLKDANLSTYFSFLPSAKRFTAM